MKAHPFALFALALVAGLALAAESTTSERPTTRRSADEVLDGVKAPAGFEMTLFAQPPEVNYPTCLTVTPRGEVFVGIDEQGSLGKDEGRGRIVRCLDIDGDGVADEFKQFAKLDHPRGLVWDDPTRSLYVLHPPNLTRHFDDDNDGVVDRSVTLITGIYNPVATEERGADHTTNGIQLAIDGWIYIAVGDFGVFNAVGADGTRLTLRGGGIVRVRTDGSDMETFTTGMRNIYDVAVDPFLNIFTRDNTNDGGGWNDRLTYSPPGAYHGYPSRFKRFADEIVDCMIDFGGGSPCGSLFVDEPGLPEGFGHTLYTVEWGQNQVDRHPLTPSGAGFKATTKKVIELPRGTDIDVDRASRLYISSWAGGGFRYTDPNVGYVIRLSHKGYTAPAFPDLGGASDEGLLKHLVSPSGVLRQATQREILRRGDKPVLARGLSDLTTSDAPLATRAIALFTLKRLRGDAANEHLLALAERDDLRELSLRALADRKGDTDMPAAPFLDALRDPNPRVRLIAAWGLARLGHVNAAPSILPLTGDSDPLVAHVAVNALVTLKAIDASLAAVSTADPKLAWGALQVLRQVHDDRVVDGLAKRLDEVKEPALRWQIYRALCRLHFREADWGGTGWWGTRPDTSGPYYQPIAWSGTPRVAELIRRGVANERPEVVRSLLIDAAAHKIDLPEVNETLAQFVLRDSALAGAFVDTLSGRKTLSEREMKAVTKLIASEGVEPAVRAKAIRLLGEELDDAASVEAAVDALGPVAAAEKPEAELAAALESFLINPQQFRNIQVLSQLASSGPAARREVALAALINIAESKLTKPEARVRAEKAVARGWDDEAMLVPLLRAIGRTKAQRYSDEVRARLKSEDAAVASAAAYAAGRLEASAQPHETIAAMGYDQALALAAKLEGDPMRGKELFTSQGCFACHTVSPDEPPKGPFLGGIATRYSRAELLESVVKPSAKIAQGFETQWFKTNDDVLEGFITRESGDEIELRNLTGTATVLKKEDVSKRGKRDTSMMPTNLVDPLSPEDLASLVAYLESLKAN
ncbi:MAG TPA: HEAT repeat domain-containing protein [Tepidisphaeraceae bacterium]|nr:HEAT repeat domain-containing protein [Tepidisphaeraceae bacterium]